MRCIEGFLKIVLVAVLLAAAAAWVFPLAPAISARMAPNGYEREAMMGATGLAYGQLMATMHSMTVIGLLAMGVGGMLILAVTAVSLARHLGYHEREIHHYHEIPPALHGIYDVPLVEVDHLMDLPEDRSPRARGHVFKERALK